MEVPSEVLIHNDLLGLKGVKGRLLTIGREGYYEVNMAFGGDRVHRVLLPMERTVLIAERPEETTVTERDVER
jgi:hypothetical protein